MSQTLAVAVLTRCELTDAEHEAAERFVAALTRHRGEVGRLRFAANLGPGGAMQLVVDEPAGERARKVKRYECGRR